MTLLEQIELNRRRRTLIFIMRHAPNSNSKLFSTSILHYCTDGDNLYGTTRMIKIDRCWRCDGSVLRICVGSILLREVTWIGASGRLSPMTDDFGLNHAWSVRILS
jgi:hypothetical protein